MFAQYLWRRKFGAIAYMALATLSAILLALFTLRIADVFSLAQIGDYSGMLKLFGFMFCWYIAIRVLNFLTEVAGIHVINQIREDIKDDLFDLSADISVLETMLSQEGLMDGADSEGTDGSPLHL